MARAKPYLPALVDEAAKAYHVHHFGCRDCQAAGMRRTDDRCQTGAELHTAYAAAFATMPPLPAWKPRAKKP